MRYLRYCAYSCDIRCKDCDVLRKIERRALCVVDVRVFLCMEIWVVGKCVIVYLWFSVCVISDLYCICHEVFNVLCDF